MEVAVAKRLITVEEYYKMAEVGILKPEDRVELLNGELFEMSPTGSRHAGIVNRLARMLNILLQDQVSVGIQTPVRIDHINEPEPDISILNYRLDDYSSSHPGPNDVLLVIEVASSSIRYDREVKMPIYARSGIPEFWIIDIENQLIEVFRKPKGRMYTDKQIFNSREDIPLMGETFAVKDLIIFQP